MHVLATKLHLELLSELILWFIYFPPDETKR